MTPHERDLEVLALREGDELTFKEIGKRFSVGAARANQLYDRAVRRRHKGTTQMAVLSTRAVNVLTRAGISTKEEARAAFLSGQMEKFRECGLGTLNELIRWVNPTAPPTVGGNLPLL